MAQVLTFLGLTVPFAALLLLARLVLRELTGISFSLPRLRQVLLPCAVWAALLLVQLIMLHFCGGEALFLFREPTGGSLLGKLVHPETLPAGTVAAISLALFAAGALLTANEADADGMAFSLCPLSFFALRDVYFGLTAFFAAMVFFLIRRKNAVGAVTAVLLGCFASPLMLLCALPVFGLNKKAGSFAASGGLLLAAFSAAAGCIRLFVPEWMSGAGMQRFLTAVTAVLFLLGTPAALYLVKERLTVWELLFCLLLTVSAPFFGAAPALYALFLLPLWRELAKYSTCLAGGAAVCGVLAAAGCLFGIPL